MGFREEVRGFYATLATGVLPLGMGCATIGHGSEEVALATLDAAYEGGMRYFDTSAQYGASEFRVGRFLRKLGDAPAFVATKSPIPASLSPGEAAFFVKQALRNSLERLGREQIDLFQIHDVEELDQVLAPGGVLETLIEAKNAGLIRYFGLATRFHDLLETAATHGAFDTILTYLDYTLLDQSAAPLIALADRQKVGVICGSPLAFGLLTGTDPRLERSRHGDFRRQRGLAGKLFDFSSAHHVPLLGLALRFPMRNPHNHMTLTGPGTPEELHAALNACQAEIPEEVWRTLEQTIHSTGEPK